MKLGTIKAKGALIMHQQKRTDTSKKLAEVIGATFSCQLLTCDQAFFFPSETSADFRPEKKRLIAGKHLVT